MKNTQVILVTGGSSGIGLATAESLMKRGHIVYAVSRHCIEDLSDLSGGRVFGVTCDVCDEQSVISVVHRILREQGRIDAVVCNAGNGIAGAIEDCTDSECRKQFEVNFWGMLNTVRSVLPSMRERGNGKVVAVSSIAGIVPIPYQGFYSASKAAVLMIMQVLAMETESFGIKCSCVLPGDTKTNFTSARVYSERSENPNSPYRIPMLKAISKMENDEQNGMSPYVIADSIVKQIEVRNPEMIVIPGSSYKMVNLLAKLLPVSLKLKILRMMY